MMNTIRIGAANSSRVAPDKLRSISDCARNRSAYSASVAASRASKTRMTTMMMMIVDSANVSIMAAEGDRYTRNLETEPL